MPIISKVEAKYLKVRIVYLAIYIMLILGAISMIYPMTLMISGSFKSETDIYTMDMIPKYFFDDKVKYQKFLESKYSGMIQIYQQVYHSTIMDWRLLDMPQVKYPELTDLFEEFSSNYACPEWQILAHTYAPTNIPFKNCREFRKFLEHYFNGSLEKLNRALNTVYSSFMDIHLLDASRMASRRYRPGQTEYHRLYTEFKMSRPPYERIFIDLDGYYQMYYAKPIYTDIENYNTLHKTNFNSFNDILLTARAPLEQTSRHDWDEFVRNELNLTFIKLDYSQKNKYHTFLKDYYGDINTMNKNYGTGYGAFSDIFFPEKLPQNIQSATDWEMFVLKHADIDAICIYGPRQAFEQFLQKRGVNYSNIDCSSVQCAAAIDADVKEFYEHKKEFFVDTLKRNYTIVLEYILMHGRGIVNTVIYCFLAVLTQLIVNPLAAYALSRYKPPSTYKILLFCMVTMAFPPAVTMIPSFLLLRELDMLNTFSALLLPVMANGYMIFLLKGFFDSLPRELYEAADIDGASEWRKFWMITMSLSKPILAVLALQAFTAAYSNFMYALIIIPDQKMWTLMVWLYKLQLQSHQAITYAALCLAAIPTFVIFLLAQNVIMRGIVVPVEK